ncbi:MAG: hypothetical protein ACRDO0_16870 [Nocardioidaceae bacterium]
MNMIWRVALAGAVLAVVGGFFVGRVVADPTPLPAVRAPVNVGPSAKPTPSDDATTLRTRDRTPGQGRTGDDDRGRPTAGDDDNSGPGGGDDGHGRGRGRGRGGDDDVRTVGPSPRVLDDDGGDDDGGGDDGDDDGGDD